MFETAEREAPPNGGDFSDVSGVLLAHLLGDRLAALELISDSVAGDAELVDVAVGLGRLEAWAVAQRARVIELTVRRTRRELERHGLARHGDGRGTSAGRSHAFDDERLAERMVSTDLSLALGLTPWAADRELDLASGLAVHPGLRVAVASGRIDRRRAEVLLAETAPVADLASQRRVIDSIVGDGGHGADDPGARAGLIKELHVSETRLGLLSPAALRRAARRECAALDPGLFAEREATARRSRHIEWRSLPDSLCELGIQAPAHAIAAAHTNIDFAARAARAQGDWRTLDQLRSDIAIGWLTEGAFGTLVVRPDDLPVLEIEGPASAKARPTNSARQADSAGHTDSAGQTDSVLADQLSGWVAQSLGHEPAGDSGQPLSSSCEDTDLFSVRLPRPKAALVVIAMTAATGLGLDDEPATLFGPGGPMPIPAGLAREIAHDPEMATWLGLFTDSRTGVAVDISATYRPPPRMRMFVRLRDGLRSRLPSSQVRRVELDHMQAYDHDRPDRGGQTTPGDLVSVGLREHHLKTDGVLSITGDANGALTFTTRTGHEYVSWPELWDTPVRFLEPHRLVPRPRSERLTGDPPF